MSDMSVFKPGQGQKSNNPLFRPNRSESRGHVNFLEQVPGNISRKTRYSLHFSFCVGMQFSILAFCGCVFVDFQDSMELEVLCGSSVPYASDFSFFFTTNP